MGVKANLVKKTAIFLTLAVLLAGCASRSPVLKPPDSDFPAAGICAEPSDEVVTVSVNLDVPDPRCSKVTGLQHLRVVNNRDDNIRVWIAEFESILPPGEEWVIDMPFGAYLLPGVHIVHIESSSFCCGADLWLNESE